ncbi:unnamed protein product [Orchesella dallaii]|uniref:Nitric oxide-associated protein 1 n=1 Tax=Orchesella dallaii TaxID=48710 RepID=A0ABP1RE33_9HEXA
MSNVRTMYRPLGIRLFTSWRAQSLTTAHCQQCRLYGKSKVLRSTVNNLNVEEDKGPSTSHTTPNHDSNQEIGSSSVPMKKDLSWMDKLVYSSYLEKFMPPAGFRKQLSERYEQREAERKEMVAKSAIYPPISVKYYMELQAENQEQSDDLITSRDDEGSRVGESNRESSGDSQSEEAVVQFPYQILRKTEFINEEEKGDQESRQDPFQAMQKEGGESDSSKRIESFGERLKMRNIDLQEALEGRQSVADMFDAALEIAIDDQGTPNPRIPPSNVPCGGCGALIHCQDVSIPGYISSEKFENAHKMDLMGEICYRCSVLETQQATLNVNVSAEDYPRIVGKIKETFSMALLMVDLTDFPCSIWPGILDIIGPRRPVFLIGNKVDLLPQDSPQYLKHIENSLVKCAVDIGMLDANIMHTALISAKTGYGVEDLITTIFNIWKAKGDIFIMGCTNVGKSSLFNMFLQSDLCKPQAADLVQRATISQWPGTTLNLLKFPLTSPYGWRGGLRYQRLMAERPAVKADEKERRVQLEITGDAEYAVLKGHVGRTFISEQKLDAMERAVAIRDPFNVNPLSKSPPPSHRLGQWDPDDHVFTKGNWVYDTPGAVSTNQILDLLTLPELTKTLPKTLIQPRTFFIKPGFSLFVAGLARLDFVEGFKPIRFTLFANSELPVTMTFTNDADEVYKKGIGTNVFGVPAGDSERLKQFPEFESKEVTLEGKGHSYSCGDVVLSSIGWIAVTAGQRNLVKLVVHTPGGKGIFVRTPALLPKSVNWKGKRIRGTYAYLPHILYMPKHRVAA